MTVWRLVVCGLLVLQIFGAPAPAEAGLLSKLLREAADNAGDAGKTGGRAARNLPDGVPIALAKLPDHARNRSLAAEPTGEGQLRLTNAKGETVTAANAAEIAAALKWLLPEASDLGRRNVDYYVPREALYRQRPALDLLPGNARVRVIDKAESYAVLGAPPFGDGPLLVQLRANLVVRIDGDDVLGEAVWQMRRPVRQSSLRVLTLDPEASDIVPRLRTKIGGKSLPPEAINPYALAKDLGNLRGQTVLLTGKIDGELLFFTPPSGKMQSVLLSDIRAAALRDDVNLIVLNVNSPRQPGVRNLLWQRAEVDGLSEALEKATMGDFFGALARGRGPLEVSISANGATHVSVKAVPRPGLARRIPDSENSIFTTTESIFSDLVANVSGNVVASGIEAAMRSEARDMELDLRIVPGIPSDYQILYIFSIVVGLLGISTAISWWRKLWPVRDRAAFRSTLGLVLNRALRWVVFALAFLPLVAFVATPYHFMAYAWVMITAPFRWIFRRRAA